MKKKIILFGVFSLLIIVKFSGCVENNNGIIEYKLIPIDRFIGTWRAIEITDLIGNNVTNYTNDFLH